MSRTQPPVLSDDAICTHLTAPNALTWTEEALRRRADGDLVSPPRVRADLGDGSAVFTVGASGQDWYGFRAYDTLPTEHDEQVVVAFERTGRVAALAIGTELGARRTGALGGVAAKHLTGGVASRVAVIGAGRQAWAQLWAVSGFASPGQVSVFSRTASTTAQFVNRAARELGLPVVASPDARTAVDGAELVILATSSPTPVVDTAWLASDVVVNTVGPKQVGRAEFDVALVSDADFVTTDSPVQLRAYDPPALLGDDADSMVDLASVVAGRVDVPLAGRRVYCSVGLSGTEVHLLGRLARQMHV